ncbi:MAG TPA: hypothetical protein V6C81_07935 [Planktothrix sp.]|jgi:hypothetical protein
MALEHFFGQSASKVDASTKFFGDTEVSNGQIARRPGKVNDSEMEIVPQSSHCTSDAYDKLSEDAYENYTDDYSYKPTQNATPILDGVSKFELVAENAEGALAASAALDPVGAPVAAAIDTAAVGIARYEANNRR